MSQVNFSLKVFPETALAHGPVFVHLNVGAATGDNVGGGVGAATGAGVSGG